MKKKWELKSIVLCGVMAAAVYTASAFLQIPIPTAIGSTRLHLGNVTCLLAGMLLGPVNGGLAAGIGSMFFDLTNPAYVASAPFTFAFKFAMAWLCGKIIRRRAGAGRYFAGAVSGSMLYMSLYLAKSFAEHRLILGLPLEAVLLTIAQKAAASGINAVVAVAVAAPLGLALRPAAARLLSEEN